VSKRRVKLPAYLYPTNFVFKALSRMGLHIGVVNMLTVAGRTSGQPRSTPVSPVRLDGRRFIVAPMPQADWVRNVRAAGRGRLKDGKRTQQVTLRELDDPQLRREIMSVFPAQVPHGVRLYKALGLVDGADPAQFVAAADDRVTAFEVLPAPSP